MAFTREPGGERAFRVPAAVDPGKKQRYEKEIKIALMDEMFHLSIKVLTTSQFLDKPSLEFVLGIFLTIWSDWALSQSRVSKVKWAWLLFEPTSALGAHGTVHLENFNPVDALPALGTRGPTVHKGRQFREKD